MASILSEIARGFNIDPAGAFMAGRQKRQQFEAGQVLNLLRNQQLERGNRNFAAQDAAGQAQAAARAQVVELGGVMAPRVGELFDERQAAILTPMLTSGNYEIVAQAIPQVMEAAKAQKQGRTGQPKAVQFADGSTGFGVFNPDTNAFERTSGGAQPIPPKLPQRAPRDLLKTEAGLRKEFTNMSKSFRAIGDAFSRIQTVANDPSAAGDITLIFAFMKMIDPQSTVREGEFATAEQAGGVPSRVLNLYNKAVSGERLPDATRSDFLNQATNIFSAQRGTHQSIIEQYTDIATKAGVDVDSVILDFVPPVPPPAGFNIEE